jgi:hypothetical protein
MHEALCRSSGTTLDILHVERRAADPSANIGSKGGFDAAADYTRPGTSRFSSDRLAAASVVISPVIRRAPRP